MTISTAAGHMTPRAPFLVLVEPDTAYSVEVAGEPGLRETYLIFSPRAGWANWLDWPELLSGVRLLTLQLSRDQPLVDAVEDAGHALRSAGPLREPFAYNALERALLLAYERNPAAEYAQLDPRVKAAVEYMATEYGEPTSVEFLAERAHMSASRFAHLFSEQIGQSPMRYLEHIRMTEAQQRLISTAEPIAEIARAVGFENPYHFSTRFRKHVGRSPRAYRQRPGRD